MSTNPEQPAADPLANESRTHGTDSAANLGSKVQRTKHIGESTVRLANADRVRLP